MEKRKPAYRTFVEKPERERSHWKTKFKWEENIKIYLSEKQNWGSTGLAWLRRERSSEPL